MRGLNKPAVVILTVKYELIIADKRHVFAFVSVRRKMPGLFSTHGEFDNLMCAFFFFFYKPQ